jgi:hypothetical protein
MAPSLCSETNDQQELLLGELVPPPQGSLSYPCEPTKDGWLNAASGKPMMVRATYWTLQVERHLSSLATDLAIAICHGSAPHSRRDHSPKNRGLRLSGDPVVGDFSISGSVLVAFARLFHSRHASKNAPRCRPRSLSSDAVQPAFSKAGLPSTVRGRKSGENTMLRLFTVAGFALAVATSAQAMSPAPLQPDGMITQVRLGCGPGRTRVEGVCVARTTIRHARRAVRRGY